MSHALRILQAVDARLDHPVEFVLYGRAAIALGFPNPPLESLSSRDVDGIIPADSLVLGQDENWWEAVEQANEELTSHGLYMTHLFGEEQVILRPDWRGHLVSILLPGLRFLAAKRPATLDLILTKMMRGLDPQDMADVRFYLEREPSLGTEELQAAFASAAGAEVDPQTWELFEAAKPAVLAMARETRERIKAICLPPDQPATQADSLEQAPSL